MLYGPCEAFKQACCELSFVEIVLNFDALCLHGPRVHRFYMNSVKSSNKPVMSYHSFSMCFNVVSLNGGVRTLILKFLPAMKLKRLF